MSTLAVIVGISTVIWFIVDRIKTVWESLSWGKWITIFASGVLSALCVFFYGLDLISALGIGEANIMGQILTVLIFMSGSSAVNEIIKKINGGE